MLWCGQIETQLSGWSQEHYLSKKHVEGDDEGKLGWCNLKCYKHVDHLSGLVWYSTGESHVCECLVQKKRPKMKKAQNSPWPLPDSLEHFTIFSGQHGASTFRQSNSFINNRLLPSSSSEIFRDLLIMQLIINVDLTSVLFILRSGLEV